MHVMAKNKSWCRAPRDAVVDGLFFAHSAGCFWKLQRTDNLCEVLLSMLFADTRDVLCRSCQRLWLCKNDGCDGCNLHQCRPPVCLWFHPEPLCHHELLPLQGLSASNCGVKSEANRQTKHKQTWVSLHLQASHFPGLMHLPNFWVLQFQQMVIEPVHSCNRWGELAGWMPFPIVQDLSPSGSDCSPCSPKDKAPSNNPQFSKSWWIDMNCWCWVYPVYPVYPKFLTKFTKTLEPQGIFGTALILPSSSLKHFRIVSKFIPSTQPTYSCTMFDHRRWADGSNPFCPLCPVSDLEPIHLEL